MINKDTLKNVLVWFFDALATEKEKKNNHDQAYILETSTNK